MAAFDATKHDIGINGVGYLLADRVPVVRADAVPATARAASGEGRYDSFQTESFYAQSEWGGGAGQARAVAPDQFLTGIGDGGWGGTFFPARKKITESDGGTASWFFERQGTLYGLTASHIETIGTATSASITAGTPLCKPVVSAADNVLWVTNESGTKKIRRWDGTNYTDITVPNVTPTCVSRFGRSVQAYGQRTKDSTPSVRQTCVKTASSSTTWTNVWTSTTYSGAYLVMALITTSTGNTPTVPADWGTAIHSSTDTSGDIFVYAIENSTERSGVERVTWSGSTTGRFLLIEPLGLATTSVLDITAENTSSGTSAGPNLAGATSGTLSQSKNLALSFWCATHANMNGSPSVGSGSSFTELSDLRSSAFISATNYLVTAATTSIQDFEQTATTGLSAAWSANNVLIVLRGNVLTADLLQTTAHYTLDDGNSWTEFYQGDTTGIPKVTTALAAQGFLWLGTTRGVYQMAIDEHEFEDHQIKFLAGIKGPVDEWSVPYNTASVCTWMAAFDGLIYYNVGSTLRQFAPGGTGRQVWPSEAWNTVSGEVQSVVSGEGGIYFGAAGYLWRYNGRGVMPIAAEPAADDFDFMQWHNGRLYFADDPASYFNFQYPSSRPDIALTSAANFTTGYVVSSKIDFEKTSESKVIRQFELQGFFTGGTNSTETGSIALHYIVADGISDPGKLGGGATSLTWISCGTAMTFGDGGIKRYALGTPATAKAIYLRVTLTPGTVGYPVLTAMIANGRAIMPVVHRITGTVDITTGMKDRANGNMYETKADAAAAIAALETLRTTGTYFNVDVVLSNSTSTPYVCTFDQHQDSIVGFRHDDQMSAQSNLNFLEVP